MSRTGSATAGTRVDVGGPAFHGTFNRWAFHMSLYRTANPSGAGEKALQFGDNTTANDGGYQYDTGSSSARQSVYVANSGGTVFSAKVATKLNGWNAITGIFDGVNVTNVTNFQIAQTAISGSPGTNAPTCALFNACSSRGGTGQEFLGSLGRVTLWDTALTLSEAFFLQGGGDPKELAVRNSRIVFDYLMGADNFIDTMNRRNGTPNNALGYFSDPPPLPAPKKRKFYLVSQSGSARTLSGALAEVKDSAAVSVAVKVSGW